MSESTQTATVTTDVDGNILAVERPVAAAVSTGNDSDRGTSTPTKLYDAEAENALPYTVVQDNLKYEIAHVLAPVSDERYMQWQRDMKVRGNGDKLEEESREANCKLWDEIIVRLDGVEVDEGDDFRNFVPPSEKNQAINDLFAVAIGGDPKKSAGKLKLGKRDTQTIVTEAYFNGEILEQTHEMAVKTLELEKRYERIIAKQTKLEQTRGLRRKPVAEYVPQDDKLGELYDSMLHSVSGFVLSGDRSNVPLRFKVAVIKFIFAPSLDPKLVGK